VADDQRGAVVWARGGVAVTRCPRSLITGESEALVEEFIVRRRLGSMTVENMSARQVEAFVTWHRAREMGPMIERLSKRYHQVAAEELQRTLNKLPNVGEAERAHLEELTRRLVNKLLHDPISMIRKSEGLHGTSAQYLHALEQLFKLQGDEESGDESGGGEGE